MVRVRVFGTRQGTEIIQQGKRTQNVSRRGRETGGGALGKDGYKKKVGVKCYSALAREPQLIDNVRG